MQHKHCIFPESMYTITW